LPKNDLIVTSNVTARLTGWSCFYKKVRTYFL